MATENARTSESMAMLGRLREFDEHVETFSLWKKQLLYFMQANNVSDAKKKPVLMSTLGPRAFRILHDLVQPEDPEGKTVEQLLAVLESHYQPKTLVTSERYKFHSRNQKESETISEYVTQLKHLSATCQFGSFLPDALRDRVICGISNNSIRQKLIEADLPFEDTVQRAMMLEKIEKEAKTLHGSVKLDIPKPANHLQISKIDKAENRKGSWHQRGDNPKAKSQTCYRCLDERHAPTDCPYKMFKCRKCSKVGHLAKACKSKIKVVKSVETATTSKEIADPQQTVEVVNLWEVENSSTYATAYRVTVIIEGKPISMIVDTGAVVTIMPEDIFETEFPNILKQETDVCLQAYGGHRLPVIGEAWVTVKYQTQEAKLRIVLVKTRHPPVPPLLGREWLQAFKLDWPGILSDPVLAVGQSPTHEKCVQNLKSKFPMAFRPDAGKIQGFEANLVLKENAIPVFCKARSIPFALQPKVEQELDRLIEQGIVVKVRHSEWATPLVIVPKADGTVRVCADFKVSVNPYLETEHYTLPTIEDIFTKVAGAKIFSVVDLSNAYLQLPVAEPSQKLLTVNTHRGLFRYTRLCFGISAAPMVFQSVMDQILQNIPGTLCYLDDILVTGRNYKECEERLHMVFQRLEKHGIKVREDKCIFLAPRVEYLGHVIDAEGIHPMQEKTRAIREAPTPQNITELKSYLGMINYYNRFIPNLATKLQPLYRLLRQNVEWQWSDECERAFQVSKDCLASDQVLVPYNPNLPLRLACDASAVGLGAVLSHILEDGTERPISFASKTLAPAEKNYANIEREALAIVFGIKHFHKYLFGRRFQLVTDHKPLVTIFAPRRGIPAMAAARIQRWALILSAYQYDIVYRNGERHTNVDAFSRLPLSDADEIESPINYFSPQLEAPLTVQDVRTNMAKDVTITRAYTLTQEGWPTHIESPDLQPYFAKREELSTSDGCLLWGNRIVIPKGLRSEVLTLLHEEHPGVSRMKQLARSYCWWPNMDTEIEELVKSCDICQQTQAASPPAPLKTWPYPLHKWQRVHIDFAHCESQVLLVVVDAYSKWAEVEMVDSTSGAQAIEKTRSIIARYGLPQTIVTDNGSAFISEEFENFLRQNGISHLRIPPYHPASNGQAERAVQSLKKALLKSILEEQAQDPDGSNRSLQHRIDNFLFANRITPHTTTGMSPAEIFLGRRPRTRLDLLKPNLTARMEEKQIKIREKADEHRRSPAKYETGELVWVRNMRSGKVTWLKGRIHRAVSENTFIVKVEGRLRYTHADHLRKR